MIKIIAISFFLIAVCIGCGKSADGTSVYGVDIVYTDSTGNPIFAPETDGIEGYYQDSVLVYGINDGVKTLLTCYPAPNDTIAYNSPTGRLSGKFDNTLGYTRFSPCLGTGEADLYSMTIIHLKKGINDTLKIHLTKLGMDGNIDSIWYNGQQKYFQASIDAIGITK